MKVGPLSLRVVPQQQCNGHCPCDSAQAWQLKQQLRSALVAGQWRGDTALTLPLFWWWSTVSPVFFRRYPRSSLHSFVPFPPVPVPNKPPSFCGCKAKWSVHAMQKDCINMLKVLQRMSEFGGLRKCPNYPTCTKHVSHQCVEAGCDAEEKDQLLFKLPGCSTCKGTFRGKGVVCTKAIRFAEIC